MVHLIDDMLDLPHIAKEKIGLRKGRIELVPAVHDAVENCRPAINLRAQELSVGLPSRPVYVDGDRTRLAEVFTSLLDNSVQYTQRGGHIWLTVETQGSEVIVSVRDNGVGICRESLSDIFEMSDQLDHRPERPQGGLGVGLSRVRGLVEMHGGQLEARSEGLGEGSEFVVRLPLLKAPGRAPQSDGGSGYTSSSSPFRILVVDDNKDGALSLAMMLRIMGHETKTAHDGLEALQVAEQFLPQVILLDIGLPKLNGHEVARRLRAAAWGKDMVLIAQTGWGQEEDKLHSKEAGFNFHLVKPVDPSTLEKLLAGLVLTQA